MTRRAQHECRSGRGSGSGSGIHTRSRPYESHAGCGQKVSRQSSNVLSLERNYKYSSSEWVLFSLVRASDWLKTAGKISDIKF